MTVDNIIKRFCNLEERCSEHLAAEVTGETPGNLWGRATCGLGYDDETYAENTAIIGIIYKDSKYTKVLHKDLNKATVKLGDAHVISIAGTGVLELHEKLSELLYNIRNSKLDSRTKEIKLNEIYMEYIKKISETLTRIGIYQNIPDKRNILALDIIVLY